MVAMILGDSLGGFIGMFAYALVAGIACGALVATTKAGTDPAGRSATGVVWE
jgi:hypothetical protein